jgi:hypothetical protein
MLAPALQTLEWKVNVVASLTDLQAVLSTYKPLEWKVNVVASLTDLQCSLLTNP